MKPSLNSFRRDRLALLYPICTVIFTLAGVILISAAAQNIVSSPTVKTAITTRPDDSIIKALKEHDETEEKRWRSIATQIETLRRQIIPRGAK